jgi:hypothetical protein
MFYGVIVSGMDGREGDLAQSGVEWAERSVWQAEGAPRIVEEPTHRS